VLLSQVGGFYDPEKRSFFLMADATAYGDLLDRTMIAHELCHALDDQYVDLRALQTPADRELTVDESYVVGGVVEGSATALMSLWMAKAIRGGARLPDPAAMQQQQKDQMEVLASSPPYCWLLAANYMVGANFLTRGKGVIGGDGGRAILDVSKAMPRSTEQLLHPQKYWDRAQRDEPVVLRDEDALCERVASATGLPVLERNTLGELVVALLAEPGQRRLDPVGMTGADYWTNAAARGWGGDRLLLLGRSKVGPGQRVQDAGVVWITAWDTLDDRDEFVAAIRAQRGERPGFALAVDGKAAVFAFGSARALDEQALHALLASCRFEQDGAPWSR
jgi:hypothetical protein